MPMRARRPWAASRVTISRASAVPAEEVGAAGDVEHDARGRVDPDQRGVAVAPVGDRVEQPLVGHRIARRDLERGIARTRIGKRRADREAEARGCIVHRRDPQRALDHVGDDERPLGLIRRGGAAPRQTVRRQPPEPDREVAGRNGRRAHGSPTLKASDPWGRGGF